MPTVKLSNGRIFDSGESRLLLDEARKSGVVLGYSCRTGRCGVCKAQVISGETTILRSESESLSAGESAKGIILTCCRAAVTDLELDLEPLDRLADIEIKTMPARIVSLQKPTVDVIRVLVRTPPASPMYFLPGQYVDVIMSGVRRSYSLANAPREDNFLELLIRRYPGGVLSEYWFERAKENDLIRIEGPLGTFFFREDPPRNIVFLATGTGIAPIKAILEELSAQRLNPTRHRIRVFWGNRAPNSFFWDAEELGIDVEMHNLLSVNDPDWQGEQGYVQHSLVEHGLEPKSTIVYACGSNAMITASREVLFERGLPQHRFFSDAFLDSNSQLDET